MWPCGCTSVCVCVCALQCSPSLAQPPPIGGPLPASEVLLAPPSVELITVSWSVTAHSTLGSRGQFDQILRHHPGTQNWGWIVDAEIQASQLPAAAPAGRGRGLGPGRRVRGARFGLVSHLMERVFAKRHGAAWGMPVPARTGHVSQNFHQNPIW